VSDSYNFFSLVALSGGFSEIENAYLNVMEVHIHPDDVTAFLDAASVTAEDVVIPDDPGAPIGQIWQAVILRDSTVPRTRLKLVSDLGGYGAAPARLSPIEVWV
jgi:hypothetical protein